VEERTIHLKVKVLSLAAEARIIRRMAKQAKGMVKWRLNQHRTEVVRDHSRHNLLAYGILRGVPYREIEQKCHESPDFDRVASIAKRFGASSEKVRFWMAEAKGGDIQEKVA